MVAIAPTAKPSNVVPSSPNATWLNKVTNKIGAVVERDPAVTQPLTELVSKLTQANNLKPLTGLRVVKNEAFNAFADPYGCLTYSSGFLNTASSPDEVAFVTAHEIAHDKNNHAMQAGVLNIISGISIGLGLSVGFGLVLGTYLGRKGHGKGEGLTHYEQWVKPILEMNKVKKGLLLLVPLGLVGPLFAEGNKRDMELKADSEALLLLRQANLPTHGYGEFFKHAQLAEDKLFRNPLNWLLLTLFRDHGTPLQRMQRLKVQEATMQNGTPPTPQQVAISPSQWGNLKKALTPEKT